MAVEKNKHQEYIILCGEKHNWKIYMNGWDWSKEDEFILIYTKKKKSICNIYIFKAYNPCIIIIIISLIFIQTITEVESKVKLLRIWLDGEDGVA